MTSSTGPVPDQATPPPGRGRPGAGGRRVGLLVHLGLPGDLVLDQDGTVPVQKPPPGGGDGLHLGDAALGPGGVGRAVGDLDVPQQDNKSRQAGGRGRPSGGETMGKGIFPPPFLEWMASAGGPGRTIAGYNLRRGAGARPSSVRSTVGTIAGSNLRRGFPPLSGAGIQLSLGESPDARSRRGTPAPPKIKPLAGARSIFCVSGKRHGLFLAHVHQTRFGYAFSVKIFFAGYCSVEKSSLKKSQKRKSPNQGP